MLNTHLLIFFKVVSASNMIFKALRLPDVVVYVLLSVRNDTKDGSKYIPCCCQVDSKGLSENYRGVTIIF